MSSLSQDVRAFRQDEGSCCAGTMDSGSDAAYLGGSNRQRKSRSKLAAKIKTLGQRFARLLRELSPSLR